MRLPLFSGIASLLLFVASASAAKCPPSVLEEALAKSGVHGVAEFLASPVAIEEYYRAAACFFGKEKFPRASYDAILEQLKAMTREKGGDRLAARLWETDGLGKPFTLHRKFNSFGKDIRGENGEAWRHFRDSWIAELRKHTAELHSLSPADFEAKVAQRLAELKAATPPGKAFEYFKALKSDPFLGAVANTAILREIESGALKEIFRSTSAEVVLNGLALLRTNSAKLKLGLVVKFPELANCIERAAVNEQDLLAKGVFPDQTEYSDATKSIRKVERLAAEKLDFVPAARRFHTIFKGIAMNECVGGSCDHLEKLTPERWATGALEGGQIHWVMQGDSYHGFTQATPVKVPGQPKTYLSFEMGSFDLAAEIVYASPKTGELKSTSVFRMWLEGMKEKSLPPEVGGFVKSQSLNFHNAGVLPSIMGSPEYLLGAKVPKDSPLDVADKNLGDFISKHAEAVQGENHYRKGNLWLDVTQSGVSETTILDSAIPLDLEFSDAEAANLAKGWKEFGNSSRLGSLLQSTEMSRAELQDLVARVLARLDPSEQEAVLRILSGGLRMAGTNRARLLVTDPRIVKAIIAITANENARFELNDFASLVDCTDPELADAYVEVAFRKLKPYTKRPFIELLARMDERDPRVAKALAAIEENGTPGAKAMLTEAKAGLTPTVGLSAETFHCRHLLK